MISKYEKILRWFALISIFITPFVPLIVCSSLFFPYVVGKALLFRLAVTIAFGAWAILALFEKEYRVNLSGILKGILFLVGVMFFANLFGENPMKSFLSNFERMEGWITLVYLLAYFVVLAGLFKTEKLWRRLLQTSLFVNLGINFYGVSQLLGWLPALLGTSRLDTTFGNASYLAIYTIFHIFVASFLWVRRFDKKDTVSRLYAFSIILNIYILYHTATRGAILGFVGALFLISFLCAFFAKEEKRLKKVGIISLVGVALFVTVFISFKESSFIQKSPVLNRFASISFEETTTKSRFMVWNMAWEGVKEKPLLGWGQENFNYVFNKHYDSGMYGQEEWFDRTHNVFMDWLIAGGFLGLLAYLILFFLALFHLWKSVDFSFLEKTLFSGLFFAYFVHNFFVFDNLTSYILFFMILAFINNFVKEKENEKESFVDKIDENKKTKVITPIIVLIIFSAIYFFSFEVWAVNRTLLKALDPESGGLDKNYAYFEKALSYDSFAQQEVAEHLFLLTTKINALQVSSADKEKFFVLAEKSLEEMIKKDPKNTRFLVFMGSLQNNFGFYEKGIDYLERALETSPKKQAIYFEIGLAYLNQNKYQQALEFFGKAYSLDNRYEKARNLYALAALYADEKELENELLKGEVVADRNFLNAYKKKEEFEKMVLVAEKMLGQNPNDTQSHITLAAAYYEAGRESDAIKQLEKAIELDPNFKDQGEQFIKAIRNE